jgi:hypothetical protein
MLDKLEELAKAATPGMPGERWYVLDGARVSATEPCEPVEHCGYNSVCVAITHGLNAHDNAAYIAAANPSTILRLVRVARSAKVILAHHDEGARPDQIALDELRAALKETT